jgi:predicted DNA-binding transcriptional regulator YafY
METEKQPSRVSLTKPGLHRIYRIDAAIASGRYPNSEDLASMCGTSIATISRDIDFLKKRFLAPIDYDTFNRGYYYTKKTFRLPACFSSGEDLVALGMAKSILTLYRETPLYEASVNLLESIIAPIASDGNRDWIENRIVVPPVASAKIYPNIWKNVVAGLKENRIITFEYLGTWDKEYQKRRVRPYQLLFDSGVWYLYGFSEERKATRVFSLSRMSNAQLTRDGFALPKNFGYANLTGDSYFGVFIGLEKYRFVIDCYEDAVIFATERKWAADQKITEGDDGITCEFSSTQYDKVLKWVLSCGCKAVPKEPQQLVDDWKWHVREMKKAEEKRKTA